MAHENNIALVVFAKVPGIGIAKTRIAAASDDVTASRAYDELLQATATSLADLPYHVAFTGADDPGALRGVFAKARSFFPQVDRSLGDRLLNACNSMLKAGHTGFCAVGCDCPEMSTEDMRSACHHLLDRCDIVLGPAQDGGYYLAGCTARGSAIFSATGWSTPGLFSETLAIADREELSRHILPARADIDTLDDYVAWKDAR